MRPVAERLFPVALVLCLAGAAFSSLAAPTPVDRDTRAYNLAHGRVVFTEHCLRCHEQGRKGAPMLGEAGDWTGRLDQPLDRMIGHAIDGHGDMPARGETELVDQEIAAAVAYVVSRARLMLARQIDALPPTGAGRARRIDTPAAIPANSPELADEAVMNMFLLLIGKERWR